MQVSKFSVFDDVTLWLKMATVKLFCCCVIYCDFFTIRYSVVLLFYSFSIRFNVMLCLIFKNSFYLTGLRIQLRWHRLLMPLAKSFTRPSAIKPYILLLCHMIDTWLTKFRIDRIRVLFQKGVRFVCLNRYVQIDRKQFGQSEQIEIVRFSQKNKIQSLFMVKHFLIFCFRKSLMILTCTSLNWSHLPNAKTATNWNCVN